MRVQQYLVKLLSRRSMFRLCRCYGNGTQLVSKRKLSLQPRSDARGLRVNDVQHHALVWKKVAYVTSVTCIRVVFYL